MRRCACVRARASSAVVSVRPSSRGSETGIRLGRAPYEYFFQPQLTCRSEAIPIPTKAPMMECVVDTGKPNLVAVATQTLAPNSAQTIARIKTPGLFAKGLTEKTPVRTAPVTRWPKKTAPDTRLSPGTVPRGWPEAVLTNHLRDGREDTGLKERQGA